MNETPPNAVEVQRVAIDWYRSTPWWRLATHTVGISWRASHLLLCAVGLLLTYLLTNLSFAIFNPEYVESPLRWIEPSRDVPALVPFDRELHQVIESMAGDPTAKEMGPWYHRSPDSFLQVWRRYASYPFQALESLTLRRAAYLLFNTLAVIAIWSFVGGCIARRAIQELGTRITAPWTDTVGLVSRRWLSIAWAAVMPLALVLICCLVPLLLGWVSDVPAIGPWVAGLLMLPMVILSLGLGWVASISLFGFPLSTAAIVCEKKADAFDGVSRAAAYTFQRPLTLILAVIAAEWLGHFAGGIVSIVVNTGFSIVSRAFGVGSFYPLKEMGTWWDGIFAAFVPLTVTAFGFSFFWTASAAIYLILRRDVDHAEYDLIDMDSPAAPKPLPPLPAEPRDVATSAVASASEPLTPANAENPSL